jgi:hypothetical protein
VLVGRSRLMRSVTGKIKTNVRIVLGDMNYMPVWFMVIGHAVQQVCRYLHFKSSSFKFVFRMKFFILVTRVNVPITFCHYFTICASN